MLWCKGQHFVTQFSIFGCSDIEIWASGNLAEVNEVTERSRHLPNADSYPPLPGWSLLNVLHLLFYFIRSTFTVSQLKSELTKQLSHLEKKVEGKKSGEIHQLVKSLPWWLDCEESCHWNLTMDVKSGCLPCNVRKFDTKNIFYSNWCSY